MAEPKRLDNGMYLMRVRYKHPFTKQWCEKQKQFKTKKLCREWETKIRADNLDGNNPDRTKLATFFDTWYETFKKHSVGVEYTNKIKRTKVLALEFFGKNIALTDITRISYQQFINYLGIEKNLAVATVKDYHKIFRAMLMEAQENKLISSNPSRKINIVGRDTEGERKKELTMDEWKKLLNVVLATKDSSSKYVTLTMMFIGARFQEVDGLLVSDVDLKTATININKAFDYKRTKEFTKTKNAGSKRIVDIPQPLVDILRPYIAKRKGGKKIVTLDKTDEKPVFLFPGDLGIPIVNRAINKYLERCCKKAGIERITSHAFRHSKTDMLVLAGADMIYTQKQLGHKDTTTTLKYYSSLNEDIRVKNKNIQEAFLKEVISK